MLVTIALITLVLSAGCQDVLRLSGKFVAHSSSDRVETDSNFPRQTVNFDMGSEIEFEADGGRELYRAVIGQRVMTETYAMGGGVPCIVDRGRAHFHKESFTRSQFQFSFECHYEGQNGTSGYSFDGERE